MSPLLFLTVLIFLPTAVALVLTLVPGKGNDDGIRYATLATTIAVLLMTLAMAFGWTDVAFETGESSMQHLTSVPWIPTFRIDYLLGTDGISFPLIVLTTAISALAMAASWSITKHVKAYCILFLLLETGMLGVFLALDFFLFYVFWEVMLLPMYFLIGVWGGPRKEYAAIKFFLYTLLGSVLMLVAILMLYFASDLRTLDPSQLIATGVVSASLTEGDGAAAAEAILSAAEPQHTFNMLAMQQMGQAGLFSKSLQMWAFVLLFIGFAIKVPSVPLHTWLPDAHVEAPTPISMILAGVLLKMGGYGIIRICYPICPEGGYELAMAVCTIGVVSMVYGAFAALAQTDFKRMVAYSSVSHMGYVVLGLGVWSANWQTDYVTGYWKFGMNGAMFQMIAHGISSAGMFFMVGVIYDRVHHRNLNEFGGLFRKMPVYSGMAFGIFFAGLGLPALCGFIGEAFVLFGTWKYSITLAVIAAAVVILTAAYILWALQRVYLGADYRGPHAEGIAPITAREFSIAAPLLALAILFGVLPSLLLDYMAPSVNQTVDTLAEWTEANKPRPDSPAKAENKQADGSLATPDAQAVSLVPIGNEVSP